MREGGVDDDKGIMVNDAEGWGTWVGQILNCMREGISVSVVVVVLMVVVWMVMLVIVVVLMIVVGVVCLGAVEVGCSGVVEIFVLGVVFVVVVVEVELVVGCVMKLVLWCSNGRGDFLWRFSLMLVEENDLSVGSFWDVIFWGRWWVQTWW